MPNATQKTKRARLLLSLTAVAMLAGCAAMRLDSTTFTSGVATPADTVQSWTVATVNVVVPDTLTVSEDPDVRFPGTDIVWWEDPQGDRRAQVDALLTDAVDAAVADLTGPVAVNLTVTLRKFHALTPRARASGSLGWHDVLLDLRLTDANGAVIAEETGVKADLKALQGSDAARAVEEGRTQRSRISGRVTDVIRAWLGMS
ncbi:MAG: DUF6778 family protein [Pseudomonadota bacterium]